jgi:hypothetical protein
MDLHYKVLVDSELEWMEDESVVHGDYMLLQWFNDAVLSEEVISIECCELGRKRRWPSVSYVFPTH